MVTMEQLQAFMRKAAQDDNTKKYVNVSGDSLEEALREAAVELGLPIKKIEYEILERGSSGMLGMGKRPFLLVAYPAQLQAEGIDGDDSFDMDFGFDSDEIADTNGQAFVRLTPEGIMLKVTPPEGDGERVTERQAMHVITRRTRDKVDTPLIAKVVKRADAEWVRIGEFMYNPANDAYVSCDIVEAEMKAVVTLTAPGEGGADPSVDAMRGVLEASGVVHGINEEALAALEDNPIYREPVVVAEGTKPRHGADARMVYNFKTDSREIHLQQTKDGKVDFKELNRIENVVEGQVLARKVQPEQGEPGETVTGRMIPAKDGKDIPPPLGDNTRLSDDERSILAEINGLVKLVNGKVTVEPIYLVDGDVNIKEGNIHFLGTVIVKGSVDDGFSVSAAGDIEVMGSVGKGVLEAEGDIIVHQGIAGKGDGTVTAGGSIWSKFIENGNAQAGEMVVVSDGIINSSVFADERIICRGRRASIVGGHIRAAEEVDAKTLGSVAGMETIVEVGYDPKSRERLLELEASDGELAKNLEELSLNMSTIENMRKNKRKISPEKIKQYAAMKMQREKVLKSRQKIGRDIKAIQDYLDELKTHGRISVSGTVYPGVKVA
ncbi:MAG: FapA family protein, partial [Spirochaetales bacterium]|nr:FapA family protein [Spirochaetales bacterium]